MESESLFTATAKNYSKEKTCDAAPWHSAVSLISTNPGLQGPQILPCSVLGAGGGRSLLASVSIML